MMQGTGFIRFARELWNKTGLGTDQHWITWSSTILRAKIRTFTENCRIEGGFSCGAKEGGRLVKFCRQFCTAPVGHSLYQN